MIKINRFIIHELKKESGKTETLLVLSEKEFQNDGDSQSLVEKIHYEFNVASKHTIFRDVNDFVFKKSLQNYLKNLTDNDFYVFTEKSLKDLERRISKESLITGGYYLFTDYFFDDVRFVAVVVLRNKIDFNLIFQKGRYKVGHSDTLNLTKLSLGFRLNFNLYSTPSDKNHIGLITSQREISDYFKEWTAVAPILKDIENTKLLVQILNGIDLPKDERGNVIMSRGEFVEAAFNKYNGNKNTRVNLRELGENLYGEEQKDKVMQYAVDKGYQVDVEFKRDSTKWRELVEVNASVEGIDLTVNYVKFKKIVVISKNLQNIIINSPEMVKQISDKYPDAIRN